MDSPNLKKKKQTKTKNNFILTSYPFYNSWAALDVVFQMHLLNYIVRSAPISSLMGTSPSSTKPESIFYINISFLPLPDIEDQFVIQYSLNPTLIMGLWMENDI